jgi:GAF domain-containing protein
VGFPVPENDSTADQSWSVVEQQLVPEYQVGTGYLIPAGRKISGNGSKRLGHTFLLPLADAEGQRLGLIWAECSSATLPAVRERLEVLQLYATQVVYIIQSYRRLGHLTLQMQELAVEVKQAKSLTLVAPDSGQAPPVHPDDGQTLWLRAGLAIADAVNRQSGREEVFEAVSKEFISSLGMRFVLVAEPYPAGIRLSHSFGDFTAISANLEALIGQRNPLRSCLAQGQTLFAPDLAASHEWDNSPLLNILGAKAFICLPVANQAAPQAAILGISPQVFTGLESADEELFLLLSRQVAIALENLQFSTATRRRLDEMDQLLEFSRRLGILDPIDIVRTLTQSIRQVIRPADAVLVSLWESERDCLVPKVTAGYNDDTRLLQVTFRSDQHQPAGLPLPIRVFQSGEILHIAEVNFTRDYNFSPEHLLVYRDATGGRLPLSCLGLPIQAGENRLGVILLENFHDTAAFSPEDQALVASLASQAALALENARLYQASEERAAQLQALTRVAAAITSSLQVDELIGQLLHLVRDVIPYDTGTLWLSQAERLTVRAAAGFTDSEERIGLSVDVADSKLLQQMIATSQPILVADVSQMPVPRPLLSMLTTPGLASHCFQGW